MDRTQLLLVGLPFFLFVSDLLQLFSPPPQKPTSDHQQQPPPLIQQSQTLQFPTTQVQKNGGIGAVGIGNTVSIDFCSSCSYRGTAVTMKNMLDSQFPGIHVVLANYPPPLPKRLLGKVVPVFQFGVIGLVMAGEQIFPRLGFAVPPPWFYRLRANRFGTMATTWLLGNFFQSMLQSSGAFEVYVNGELVFSKLKENRFPGEIELKDLVGRRIANSRVVDGLGASSLL
ncbi:selT-like protein isoform X1 [Lycium barbarum]|uniref:selT-like protein isoform X1 n=1 Tax=Lycium barbarum TaxID=112863 RepID=UPI00293F5665|nr:selT-like protein isoform X1 [Lycium barbarum]